jgi:ActD protein
MIVARFPDAESLQRAARSLRGAGLEVETRTPIALPEDEHAPSRIPRGVLIAAVAAAVFGFALQCYGMIAGYPLLIGGRPRFFWTSYTIYAFECGVLAATSAAFVGFLLANRMPRYWEPADESDRLREATRDGWFLVADGSEAWERTEALKPLSLERVPA